MSIDAPIEQALRDTFQRHEHLAGDLDLDAARKRRIRKRKDPRWARVFVAFGALLMLVSGGALVGKDILFGYATSSVPPQNLLGNSGNEAAKKGHVSVTGAKNILLVGIDARPDQNPTDMVRSDSIIIAHVPASHDAAYLVSIPRDTRVHIPAWDNGKRRYGGETDRINAAYANGGYGLTGLEAKKQGVGLLAKTLKEAYGLSFDAAAIVDFNGFQGVVDALGGIDMYVDEETVSVHIGTDRNGKFAVPYRQYTKADGSQGLQKIAGVTPATYTVGQHHLVGWQALDFVRQRELLPHSDYDRERHQQQFIKAVLKKVISIGVLTNVPQLTHVLDAIGKTMTVDPGGISMGDWVYAMSAINTDSLVTLKTNNGNFHSNADGSEALDETTLDLLKAVDADTVGAFVSNHPDLVTHTG